LSARVEKAEKYVAKKTAELAKARRGAYGAVTEASEVIDPSAKPPPAYMERVARKAHLASGRVWDAARSLRAAQEELKRARSMKGPARTVL
jgi:hypothetical protein